MNTLVTFFLILAVFTALALSVMTGEIMAHLVLYRRRGQASRSKRKRDGNTMDFIDLIKHD